MYLGEIKNFEKHLDHGVVLWKLLLLLLLLFLLLFLLLLLLLLFLDAEFDFLICHVDGSLQWYKLQTEFRYLK